MKSDFLSNMEELEDFSEEDIQDLKEEYDIEDTLENLSLDELHELKDQLMEAQEAGKLFVSDDLKEIPDDISKCSESEKFSFSWDGGPTHETEWDDDSDHRPPIKILKR